ncbi:MAG: NAD-dependent epimerase/dehydratase family protein [Gemmataceae bacterium]|nr:NAD-dependent epimerase/dehydratase family protein [Gemmataceae bacterium]
MSETRQDGPTLVTGAAGFAGCWLVAALRARGERVVGLSRRAGWPEEWKSLDAPLVPCDLLDGPALARVLDEVRPARVYHLAGFASPGASLRNPEAAWDGNLTATRRLCDALLKRPARLLFVGSGLVYGQRARIDEETPFRPETPYAASKAAADLACAQMARASGLDAVIARPFNHTGPHQPAGYAIPDFARQLAAIERGEQPPVLEVGDLGAHRDLSDVRDVVAGYALLMERGQRGEAYNVASGASVPMSEVLHRLVAHTGLAVEVRTRPGTVPSAPEPVAVETGKLRRLGWSPGYALERTLADALDAWRAAGRQGR